MERRRWIALAVAIVLVFVSLGARLVFFVASDKFSKIFSFEMNDLYVDETIIRNGSITEKIAVIHLDGAIIDAGSTGFLVEGYDHDAMLAMIERAFADKMVDGIVLKVDSPGGGVYETAQIYRKIVEGKEEYDKPFYVSMGSMAASGGYYVSAPADKIFAESSTITGSIGVIMQNTNFSGLAERYGVTFNTIKSGKHKDIMSSTREMTDEEREILQSIIDEMYDEFVRVIAEGRSMDEADVRRIGDGRIYTGLQAKEINLVDEIGNLDDAINQMMEDHGLKDATVVEYNYTPGFFSSFGLQVKGLFDDMSELKMIQQLLVESDQPRAYYMY